MTPSGGWVHQVLPHPPLPLTSHLYPPSCCREGRVDSRPYKSPPSPPLTSISPSTLWSSPFCGVYSNSSATPQPNQPTPVSSPVGLGFGLGFGQGSSLARLQGMDGHEPKNWDSTSPLPRRALSKSNKRNVPFTCWRKSPQAKQVYVKLDGRTISPPEGFLFRKGALVSVVRSTPVPMAPTLSAIFMAFHVLLTSDSRIIQVDPSCYRSRVIHHVSLTCHRTLSWGATHATFACPHVYCASLSRGIHVVMSWHPMW